MVAQLDLTTQVCLMPEPAVHDLDTTTPGPEEVFEEPGDRQIFCFWNVDSKLVLYPLPLHPLLTWSGRGCG